MAQTAGFMVYHGDGKNLEMLDNDSLGAIMRALIRYAREGEEPVDLDPMAKVIFAMLREKIDFDALKYQKKSEAGAKSGGRPKAEESRRKQTEADGSKNKQTEAEESSDDQTGVNTKSYTLNLRPYTLNPKSDTILSDSDNGGEAANAHTCARETHEAPDTDDGSMATCAENVQVDVAVAKNATTTQKPKVKAIRHKYGEYQNVLLTDEDYEKLQAEFPTEYEALIERLSAYMASTGRAYKNHLATMRNWARRDLEKGVARSSPIPQAREAPHVYRQQTKAEELDDFYRMAAEWAAETSQEG